MDQPRIDALRGQSVPAQLHLFEGKAMPASDGGTMDVVSPIDGQVLAQMARGTSSDMETAIASALSLIHI